MSRNWQSRRKLWNTERVRSGLELGLKEWLERKGIKYGYESIRLKYIKQRCPHCQNPSVTGVYTPDFIIGDIIIECKGRFKSTDRTKMIRVKENNPDKDIRFIFQRDNTLTKSGKMTYSGWALKHGFPSYVLVNESEPNIPDRWLMEVRGECTRD